jgi:hypothetical protein
MKHSELTEISLDVSRLVKNSQFFHSSIPSTSFPVPSDDLLPLTLLHTLTLPSIPPVATISPSELHPAATTESV